ncbi:MAG: hypothetical protein A2758_01540 [Candidatus Zambryskibacteria bacterium RIFCSPHIGHO2_01_FULL_49_18]|uniref:HD domain-containing protein n=2 Tax=Candidatus Zambryskiibacteriota TaxID=1817925 RepID=A0A1G2T1Y7_9BACT|nr:MAG: hypothetical protein A2758_01540 [Candidatus Zambryskibacteria bacterium RIFCSPHIGHO2_01_FULL_49_18]OHB05180.1 MAG: hypothetical protein A3A26_02670 [Candidatus Zambryskibacteria bacterium RIFCSPLOWO2_01_FULL_47_14]
MGKGKTKFFSSFALAHMGEMRILKRGGVLGKANRDWRNVAEHCLVEAALAYVLAEHLGAERDVVVRAALLHDWYKRHEREAMTKSGVDVGHQATIRADSYLLSCYGVSDTVIRVARANIPESADIARLATRSLEEKVMHFIDLVTSSSAPVPFEERFRTLEKKEQNVAFSESYRSKFGKGLYELQMEVGRREQDEFEKVLGLASGTLVDFLRKEVEKKFQV